MSAPSISIRIESPLPPGPLHLPDALTALGAIVTTMHRSVDACALQCRSLPPSPDLAAIIPRLCPFRFRWHHAPHLDVDCVISLGDAASAPIDGWHLQVRTDDADFAASIADEFGALGCRIAEGCEVVPFIAAPRIRYGGASAFVRAVLASFVLKLCGELPRQTKVWDDDEDKIGLDLPRRSAREGLRERLPIQVRIDDPAAFAAIHPRLAKEGFGRIELHHVVPDAATRLSLDPGALSELDAHVEVAAITRALAGAARELGIDLSRYPLAVRDPASDGGAVVTMPAAAMRTGALRPWSRLHPDSFPVTIRDDDREAGSALRRTLEAAGFPVERRHLGKIKAGFAVCCGAGVPEPVQERLRGLVDGELLELGAHEFGLSGQSADGDRLEIEWPARAFREGRLLAELANPRRYALKVFGPSAGVIKPIKEALAPLGFRSLCTEVTRRDGEAEELQFGGAPCPLLTRIETVLAEARPDLSLTRNKMWPMTDHDIWVRLPPTLTAPAPVPEAILIQPPRPPVIRNDPPTRGPFLRVSDSHVWIAGIALPRIGNAVPHARAVPLSRFAGFCIDQEVAQTLWHLAIALRGRLPAALEGPTAASKTWSILYLASLLGAGVYRLNFSAQSDVSELVGKYVPDTEQAATFRFADGAAPSAMREGAWLVMDELDLAPTEIGERCNSLLETPYPALHLAEYDGRTVEAHPGFRVLSTWNGTGYAGR
ncbi:MAG TPA: AAA family ATPase, partial [Acidisphaera sp.]|nr:AAA family ATPase [Acidisphaera sp.]